MTHAPKGGMCAGCAHKMRDCSKLEFTKMRVIVTDKDGIKYVKCDDYEGF